MKTLEAIKFGSNLLRENKISSYILDTELLLSKTLNKSREKTLTIDKFQGDGSTVVFGNGSGLDLTTFDGPGASLSVTPTSASDMLVYVGGVYQIPTTNYTLSGNQITFGSAPPANDGATNGHIITIIHNLHKLGE